MEPAILHLCQQLLDETDPVKMQDLSAELQIAIHEHVEGIRRQLLAVPAATPFAPLFKDKVA